MGNSRNKKSQALSSASIVLYYALFAAIWIAASDNLLSWLIEDREWLKLLSMGKGFLFVALTSFLLYLLLDLKSRTELKKEKISTSSHRLYWLFAFQILLMPLIPTLLYSIHGHQIKQDSHSDLTALAKVKTEQIETWLKERISDGLLMQNNQSFAQAVALISYGGSEETDAIQKPLQQLQQNKEYQSLTILDAKNAPRLIYGHLPVHKTIVDTHSHGKLDAHGLLTGDDVIQISWYWDENNHLYVDIHVPLIDMRLNKTVGTLIMTQDLQTTLLPQLQSWNGATATGKTYLLQPHDDRLAFIQIPANDVTHTYATDRRYDENTASVLKLAISDESGSYEGQDIFGNNVIASYIPVKYSGWHLFVQQDQAEIYAPLYALVYWITLVVFFAGLIVIFVVSLLWRQQQYTNQLEIQRQTSEKDRLLRHFFELPLFGMAITHTQTGRWIRFNDQLADLLGYSQSEMAEQTLMTLTTEEYRAADAEAMRQMELDFSDGYLCEKQLRRKDGQLIFVNVDTRCVRAQNRSISFIISVIEDISQRKASEQQLKHQKNLYEMLSQTNQAIVHCQDRKELFKQICQIAVEHGGLLLAFIGKYDKDINDIDLLHSFGDDNGFSSWITEHKKLRPELLTHTGAMQALMSQKDLIFNDYQHEPSTEPFHEIAQKAGIASAGYFIIREKNEISGVLSLYSNTVDFFDAETQATINEMALDVSFALDNLNREQQLQESEQRFRSAIMNSPSPTVIYTESGTGLTLNSRWTELSGYDLTDVPSRSEWLKVAIPLQPDNPNLISENGHRITAPVHNGEYLIHCKDGSQRYWDMQSAPLGQNENGELLLLSMASDITARKMAEEELKKSEGLFHTLATFVPVGIFRLNLAGKLRYLNEFGTSLLRCSSNDLSHWLDALIAEDRLQLLQHWLPALLNGITGEMECRVCHGDDPCTWLVINASPEKNDQGETIGYIGSLTDITSQKNNEEILRQSATVFDHTREGIMITDTQAHILRVNPALTELFGYSEQELLHKTPAIFKSGQHSTEFYQMMWHAIETSGYWRGEIWNRRKDGELIPLIGSISSVHDNKHQLTHYVSVYTDIRQLKDSEAQLEHLARHDPLTQLPNRSLLAINLAHAIALADRRQQRVALIMLDLDRFKDVNDSFGHQIGDVLLQEVAVRLRKRIRVSDTICRLGGDEFTVLVEGNPDISAIDHMAEDILKLLTVPFHLPNGRDVIIGASIGISLYPEHGDTPEDLLQQADAAMYRAKANGRSCFRYFSDELTQAAERRLDLEVRLRRAIELNELRVYFQPQMDIASNRIIGAEALVRWQDPNRGLIAPINFIPVAEETGLIKQLGEWVLFETCRQGNEWLQKGLPAINLAVNISPVQFRYSNILESVTSALDETGFPAAHLELELTESALMTHESEVAEILNQLRQLGVRLAIDDFGTGYSSLAYLKRFPLDVLKIDKSFVDDIPHKKDDMEIAATIVAMAHTLRLKVMAEGVETEEQLIFLKSQGCDCYQGYLMSPPIPAAQFEQLLREQQPV
ncbi:EAL domain-containing protein [uncultured Tolumonas sp.]|uniref:EAL domain-containing protein n=1 Tax=uncultured Tolumonas sp. TaxID=263765 RepID=UPI002A0A7C6A|nr:EAL domain-containing protein [uncultured Tolumonas sp.]